ncbi:MAG: ribosomal protein S18-alanine N-acetyltransferase [Spirochaetia bacterium]|nr:ribosomal protein S18-alanine N-acetyltransferase [Spirochaetia bacterium]
MNETKICRLLSSLSSSKENIEILCALDKALFNPSWNETQWQNEFDNPSVEIYIMQNSKDEPIGFLSASIVDKNIEIRKVGILPEFQRKGYASLLMNKVYELSKNYNAETIILEVNETNHPAVMFYQKNGFSVFHERRNYYANHQKAFCMQKNIA